MTGLLHGDMQQSFFGEKTVCYRLTKLWHIIE